MLRKRITALCAGWEVEQVRSIVAETLHEIVEPLVYAEAADLIARHQAAGEEVVVLSASGGWRSWSRSRRSSRPTAASPPG